MKIVFQTLTGVLLAAAFFVGGCTTDTPIISNERESRMEGADLYNRTDYENAAGAFRNAVRQDPRDFRAEYYLGLTYEHLANYQQAIQAYKSALKVLREIPGSKDYADYRQVIMNTIAVCICKHDDNGLEQDLLVKQSGDLKVDDRLRAEDYFLLAKLQRCRGDADSALKSYYKATVLDKDDFWLQKEAGLYLHQMGKKFTAAKPLKRAAQLNSHDAEVNQALRDLNLPLPAAVIRNEGGAQPAFKTPMPAVDVKFNPSAPIPEQLPID